MKTTLGLFITKRGPLPALLLTLLGAGLAGLASGQVITEFPIPTSASLPKGITAGPDGSLWFTEQQIGVGNVGRITTTGVVTEFPLSASNSGPTGIVTGADGNLWLTEVGLPQIVRITTSGDLTVFQIPPGNSAPYGIAAGADGSLWFTESGTNKIGRITTDGVVNDFPIPTAGATATGIAAGPYADLWFTERAANKIGRITTTGAITEFPIPTANSSPEDIAAGPDGSFWFTESSTNKIGRITAAGEITEFLIPSANSSPEDIAVGPDGNLWFTELAGKIGRVTPAGAISEFAIPTANSGPFGIAVGSDGNLWFAELAANQIARITTGPTVARAMAVDAHAVTGSVSDTNGVLEPGETVQVAPSWKNTLTDPQTFTGTASGITGPAGPTYTINDNTADYGMIGPGATGDCGGATGDCYLMTVSGARPSAHWDATFTEDLSSNSISKIQTLHVGDSFPDVPRTNQFYGFIENLFHNGITGGCGGGNYCPDHSVTRAQMAVFLLKGKLGSSEIPPPATGTVFDDVHAGDPDADWIEQLAGFQITGGCGDGNYCPTSPVTRAQMAVFLLKAEHGSGYTPPACAGIFADVACPSQFASWIERLSSEGITGGCGNGNYCPDNPVNRGQMAVFLVKTFRLQLYGRVGPTTYTVGVMYVNGCCPRYEFQPSTIHIHAGDSITWILGGHHGTSGPGWSTGFGHPDSFTHMFTQSGSFTYYCGSQLHHPGIPHDPGVVVVEP